ncbi:MAG: ClpXP protease specificity-enhancing factor SspB [Rickettsiales bacterium]|jgi:hypothetical protein|nr:ClpXP protease specificity-enhancing factor SspB [Rickettsiales bacterium]
MHVGLDYGVLVEKAFRNMIRSVLREVQKMTEENLCLMFVVDTRHRGVLIPKYLRAQYPQNIVIILQHQFVNLKVYASHFSVELNFGGKFEEISIPFGAILVFNDKTSGMELAFDVIDWTDPINGNHGCICGFGIEYEERAANVDVNSSDNLIRFEDIKNRL